MTYQIYALIPGFMTSMAKKLYIAALWNDIYRALWRASPPHLAYQLTPSVMGAVRRHAMQNYISLVKAGGGRLIALTMAWYKNMMLPTQAEVRRFRADILQILYRRISWCGIDLAWGNQRKVWLLPWRKTAFRHLAAMKCRASSWQFFLIRLKWQSIFRKHLWGDARKA